MKKKHLILIVLVNVLVIFVSYALNTLFIDQTERFISAAMGAFLAIILIFEYKNALKHTKGIKGVKKYYEKRGELDKYQNICKFLFAFAFLSGVWSFVRGIGVIFINFIKSVWLE